MDNRIVKIAIGATIMVIMLATVLIPVVNETAATTRTFSNTDNILMYMTEIDENTEYSFHWDPATPKVALVNGKNVDLTNNTSIVLSTDEYLIRYGVGSFYYIQSSGTDHSIYANSDTSGATYGVLDIVISGGSLTSTLTKSEGDPTEATETITHGFAIAPAGSKYVMKSSTQSAYLLKDSLIAAAGLTALDGQWNNQFQITGTCDDYEIKQVYPSPATYEISDITDDKTAVDGYNDLYTLKEIKFKATQIADSSKVTNCTYNYFIVPAEVTAEITDHLDDNAGLILKTIPVMVLVALIVAIIAVIFRNRE